MRTTEAEQKVVKEIALKNLIKKFVADGRWP